MDYKNIIITTLVVIIVFMVLVLCFVIIDYLINRKNNPVTVKNHLGERIKFLKSNWKRVLVAIALVGFIASVGSGATYYVMNNKAIRDRASLNKTIRTLESTVNFLKAQIASLTAQSGSSAKKEEVENKADRDRLEYDQGTSVVNWIAPQKIDSLSLFKDEGTINEGSIGGATYRYYKIADLADGGELILVEVPSMGTAFDRFRKMKDGKCYILPYYSNSYYEGNPDWDSGLADKVGVDMIDTFQGIATPDSIIDYSNNAYYVSWGEQFFSDLDSPIKVADSIYGSIYKTEKLDDTMKSFKMRNFYLKLADLTTVSYSPNLPYYDKETGLVAFTYNNGNINKKSFLRNIEPACGFDDSSILSFSGTDNTSAIGKTSSGETVYAITNLQSQIAKDGYSIYKSIEESLDSMGQSDLKGQTIQQFYAKTPIIIIKDKFGAYSAMIDQDYEGPGGCGKPVIYLYPEKETRVSVKVGANVTISEPKYHNGWNVLAKPNGDILYNNATWPYLFWEGTGYGLYPNHNYGFVVLKSEIESTLSSHLDKLGLKQKEKQDFLDFWLTRMPDSPYIRITWLTTADMNKLAPLKITPKPDTLIRVFLDYEPLDKPIKISPQKLSSIPRKGFTVVEWGGLLQ